MRRILLILALAFVANPALAKAACTPPAGGHCVDLSWTASSTPGVTYNAYRGTVTGVCKGTKIASGLAATAFSDMNVVNGSTYFYAFSAQNSGGESTCTSEVQVLIAVPPQPPSNANAVVQ